jgi:hypothetical protein
VLAPARLDMKSIVDAFSAAAGLDAETVNGRPSFVPPLK